VRALAVSLVLLSAIVPAAPARAAEPGPGAACTLTAADKVANAKLSFDDFDQTGVGPATWRQLSNHGCWAQAVEAAGDYLAHARFARASQQRDVIFHIGQSLGIEGKYEEAALMIASAKSPDPAAGEALDWNTYLEGTWAFFKRDRAALERARARLIGELGAGNQLNGSVLSGLVNCFDRPYAIAYESACRKGQ
jgi:hypothetical protein